MEDALRQGRERTVRVDVNAGAEAIMDALARAQPLVDATGEPGTHVGGMLAQVRDTMTDITGQPASEIAIRDVLAVDTMVPRLAELIAADPAGERELDATIDEVLAAATVERPPATGSGPRGRDGEHTEHLAELLNEFQGFARSDPAAAW